MVGVKKIQTKRNEGAGSQQVSSSRRRPLSFRNATEVYCICTLETALFLFGPGGKFYNPRIEALLRGLEQSKTADPVGKKRHSERDASLQELYRQYAEAVVEWKAIKRRGMELKKLWNNEQVCLFVRPIDELNLEEMIKLRSMLEDLRVKLLNHIAENSVEPSSLAESCSSNVVESFECSASIASGGSGSVDMDVNDGVHGRN